MVDAWRRIQRWAAWLLVPLLLLQFLSGYAMLHWKLFGGLLSRPAAFRLHGWLQPFTVAAFVGHSFPWIRRALRRRRLGHPAFDAALIVTGAGLFAFAVYLAVLG